MANVIDVVPPQYAVPDSAPQMPVGGIVDTSTGNPSAQTTDVSAQRIQTDLLRVLGNVLVELQLLNEAMFPGTDFDRERQGRYQ